MKLTQNQKVAVITALISAIALVIAEIITSFFGNSSNPASTMHIEGEGNIGINQARDVHIDQSQKVTPPEAQLEGILMPANENTPQHTCGTLATSDLILFFGGRQTVLLKDRDLNIVEWGEKSLLKIEKSHSGAFISAVISREDGRIVALLDKNRFKINPNNYFKLERPDRHEIKIKDGTDSQVLRVRYVNESTFWVEGKFFIPGHGVLTATKDKWTLGGNTFSGGCDHNIGKAVYHFN